MNSIIRHGSGHGANQEIGSYALENTSANPQIGTLWERIWEINFFARVKNFVCFPLIRAHRWRLARKEGHMHDSRTVANRFLQLARQAGAVLTPMQLLKLVYIAHGWMLGLYGRPLIRDEVQAWRYGPVIPRLYNAAREYRSGPVTRLLSAPANDPLDEFEDDIVSQVYRLYGKKSGIALSRLTHADDTPWALTYEPGEFGTPIPQDLIQEHYQQLAAR